MPKKDELRVHGVSGTLPRDLLYWEPVSYLSPGERRTPQTRVWERNRDHEPDAPFRVRAFRWGNLTSGSKWSAFWILLAPFAFSNVAGWMASKQRTTQALLRLSALGMTALFTAQLSVVAVDYPYQLAAARALPDWLNRWMGSIAPTVLATVLFAILWFLSMRSQIQPFTTLEKVKLLFGIGDGPVIDERGVETPGDDPAVDALLSSESMWVQQGMLHTLRRLHMAFAFSVVALVVSWRSGVWWLAWAVFILLAAIALFTLVISIPNALAFATWASRAMSALSVALLVIAATRAGLEDMSHTPSPIVHQVVIYSAALILVPAFLATIWQFRTLAFVRALVPTGAVVIGTLLGGAFGVAAAVLTEFGIYRWAPKGTGFQTAPKLKCPAECLPPDSEFVISETQVMSNGGSWVAVAMLALFLSVLIVAAISAMWPRDAGSLPPKAEGRSLAMLRRVTLRARWVLGVTGLVGLVLAVLAAVAACSGGRPACSPTRLTVDLDNTLLAWVVAGAFGLALVFVSLAVGRVSALAGLGTGALLGGVGWLVWTENPPFRSFEVPVVALPVDLSMLVDLSFAVVVGGIAFFIVSSIVRGWGDPEHRRKVGILWDVASFWPRWFHPLAPPAYGPAAVQSLRRQIPAEAPPLLLAAHSQGSVIAAVVVGRETGYRLPKGLVTYGSPLAALYEPLFPSVGVVELCGQVASRMNGRWVNLWRDTDPIGGVPMSWGATNTAVTTDTGHSRYELTEEFFSARLDVAP